MDFEGIVAVETVSLATVIGQEDDPHVALTTPRFAVAAVGEPPHIRMNLP
jgi:hypothetical protein